MNNMRRGSPRFEVAAKQIKATWHKVRSRKISKDADGLRTVTMVPGPSLKEWVREQISSNSNMKSVCEQWLANKEK